MSTLFQSINPATGQPLQTFQSISDRELDQAVAHSRQCFETWRSTSFSERTKVLLAVADHLTHKVDEFAHLMTTEMGKPIEQARAEVRKSALACRYFAQNAESFLAKDVRKTDASQSYVAYEPLGTVFAIAPWNFPFWQVFRFAAATLMAGNTVLFKHATNTPQSALAIEKIFTDVGAPKGLMQNLFVSHEQAAFLIADPRIAGVSLTGSTRAGSEVASLAGKAIKKMVMELGGSDPFIVFADADLNEAISVGVKARCQNNGQSCVAAKRFIIEKGVYDQFTTRFVAAMKALNVGDPSDTSVEIGPLATKAQLELLSAQVDDAKKKGAKILCGGNIRAGSGYFYQPTVIAGIQSGMRLAAEEAFGPVAALTSFGSDDEALSFANESEFGLGASIWTANKARIERFSTDLQFGSVFFNAQVRSDPVLPFGGIKGSGFGRELGKEGILEFVNTKTVWVA